MSVKPCSLLQCRKARLLLAVVFVLLSGGPPLLYAAGGQSSASAGSMSQTVDFPDIANASDDYENPVSGAGHSATATGSPGGISVMARVTGEDNIAPRYSAGASFSSTQDTTFNYQPDYLGGMDDWVEVGLTGSLTGSISGSGSPYCFFGSGPDAPVGAGYVQASITASGPLYTAPPDEGGVFVGSRTASSGTLGGFVTSGETLSYNEFVSTGYFWVPRGETISFSAGMFVEVSASKNPFGTSSSHHGTVTANFADTFKFDPNAFFDIRTPGVTANSPALGIVNNQLSAAVPLPPALPLMALALAGIGFNGKKKKLSYKWTGSD